MIKAEVNGKYNFEIDPAEFDTWDVVEIGRGKYHLLIDNKSVTAEVLERDTSGKNLSIKVGGQIYEIKLEDEYDQLVRKLGLTNLSTKKINQVKAPMPGLVLDILVETGQSIRKGDSLIILEAMKMENVLKAPDDAVVKAVMVKKGASVDKNSVLIDFE